MRSLIDGHGRVVKDLRVSVTPRCNLRCTYCDPLGLGLHEPPGTVSARDVANVIQAAADLGLDSVRFTGGEPLLRKDLPAMIAHAKHVAGIKDVAVTTNGSLLARRLPELLDAGLDRVNVSLDALDPEVFRTITRGSIGPVLAGVQAVTAAGMTPVKLNAVVMRGANDGELAGLAALTSDNPYEMRFIEYMHLNNADRSQYEQRFMPGRETRTIIEAAHGPLVSVPTEPSAPARRFRVPGWAGTIGFINSVSEPFCGACSRMRLTSDGHLRPCLMNDWELDVTPALTAQDPVPALREMFLAAARNKVVSGLRSATDRQRTMVAIGG